MGFSVHRTRKHMTGAPAHRVTAIIVGTLVLLVIVSLLAAVPSFHRALGIGANDAIDDGVLIPKISTSATGIAAIFGLLAVVLLAAASMARMPHAAPATHARARAFVRIRAGAPSRRRMHRVVHAEGDADDHHTPIVTTLALRSARNPAQPGGFSVSSFCTAPYREEGLLVR